MPKVLQSNDTDPHLPRERIDAVLDPLRRFMHVESASGVVLLAATALAVILGNSAWADEFHRIWETPLGVTIGSFSMHHSFHHWINDLLMAVFFYVVGLEVKRELVLGELRDVRRAALPILAAIGGMAVPALIYLALETGTAAARGWGIPMATDIAFVVGCLALLGSRVPNTLRVTLLSLAIADDIGAIIVIAVGYSSGLDIGSLALSLLGIAIAIGLMKLGVRNGAVYLALALFIWFEFHASGIHATIAGVILGLLTPTRSWVSEGRLFHIVQNTMGFMQGERWRSTQERYAMIREMEVAARKSISPIERFETALHPWVGFLIMPLFALANAGVHIELDDFVSPVAVAVAAGLLIGKPVGIIGMSWLATSLGLARLPQGVTWPVMVGGGLLAGIGFTMALFIAGLALQSPLLEEAKVGVFAGSLLSGVLGYAVLSLTLPSVQSPKGGSRSGH
jgi:NhaA family Na+:H+ antiporter